MNWTRLRNIAHRSEAEIICGLLEQSGIQVRISSGDMGGVAPHLAVAAGFSVEVPVEDAGRANEILASPFASETDISESEEPT